jgi:DNA-binding beta-propeller fold protein YncE
MIFRVPVAVLCLCLLLLLSLRAEPSTAAREAPKSYAFSCTLDKAGLTSAGIFDSAGRLERVLWTMKRAEAGPLEGKWNGRDSEGKPAPPGEYFWRVVVNRSKYENIGTIGNTGLPPTTSGHVPVFLEGVAVDANDRIYTVQDWNEPHFSVIRWSPQNGRSEFNTGHVVRDALLKGIAVEPDGSYAYVSGYENINDRAKAKFSIVRVKLAAGEGDSKVEKFTRAGDKIVVYDGNAQFPEQASAKDRELMKMPLISLALSGDTLYASDALMGRVLLYDKESGELKKEISVPLACGIEVEPNGRIWVGHEHEKVSVLDAQGNVIATPITDLEEVRALAVRGDKLYVADRGAGQLRVYKVDGDRVSLQTTFGEPARPGDRAPARFTSIQGMAVDGEGNVVVTDRVGQGSRIQKFTPEFKQLWRQLGMEFSSQATYGKDQPDILFTSNKNVYQLDRKTGGWEFLGSAKTDKDNVYFGNFDSSHRGPPRIVRFGEKDFFFFPAGDGVAIYRIDQSKEELRGPTLDLVSALAGAEPLPDGTLPKREPWRPENRFLWSWHDEQGDNQPREDEVTISATPQNPKGWEWPSAGITVDEKGWLWISSLVRKPPSPREESTIYTIPPKGTDEMGNPIYDWNNAIRVVSENAGPRAVGLSKGDDFHWKLAGRSVQDGMIYGLANAKKPDAPQEEKLHMGGNVLMGFRQQNVDDPEEITEPQWSVVLPKKTVGLAPIPGGNGGVFIGGDPWRGGVLHYTRDGLLIGGFQSDQRFGVQPLDTPSGLLDSHLAVNCERDARDGIIDLWTEDNYNQRLIWYRIDDRDIESLEGKLTVK